MQMYRSHWKRFPKWKFSKMSSIHALMSLEGEDVPQPGRAGALLNLSDVFLS